MAPRKTGVAKRSFFFFFFSLVRFGYLLFFCGAGPWNLVIIVVANVYVDTLSSIHTPFFFSVATNKSLVSGLFFFLFF